MEQIYAVMLLNKAGKDVDEKNVSAVLKAAGVEADSASIKSLIAALDGVNIEEVIANSSSMAVAAPAAGGSSDAPAADAAAPAAEEKKKEEAPPAADASAGLGSLF